MFHEASLLGELRPCRRWGTAASKFTYFCQIWRRLQHFAPKSWSRLQNPQDIENQQTVIWTVSIVTAWNPELRAHIGPQASNKYFSVGSYYKGIWFWLSYFILINVQRDVTICSIYFILLQNNSTCFGCRPHPSSGVRKTLTTANGTSHMVKYKGFN